MRPGTFLFALLAVAPLSIVTAQETPLVKPGDRVRVTAPDQALSKYTGTLAGVYGDTLRLDTLHVPLQSVTRLDVHRGQKSKAGTGALIGAGVGAAAGVITALVVCAEDNRDCENAGSGLTAAAALVLGVGGALLGAGLGAVVGSNVKVDRWEEIPLDRLRVSVAPQRDGRFGLGLSVRF